MILRIFIVVMAIGMLFFVVGGRQTHTVKAWKKILLSLLALAMVIAVFSPDTTSWVAHLVGVGRGADLLLYILCLAFIGYVIDIYVRQQREKDLMFRLARRIALLDANNRYGINGGKRDVK